jgi:hypothetical protein
MYFLTLASLRSKAPLTFALFIRLFSYRVVNIPGYGVLSRIHNTNVQVSRNEDEHIFNVRWYLDAIPTC